MLSKKDNKKDEESKTETPVTKTLTKSLKQLEHFQVVDRIHLKTWRKLVCCKRRAHSMKRQSTPRNVVSF